VKEAVYRKIFCVNYNLSFHKPKKDQCSVCTRYHKKKKPKTEENVDGELESEYNRRQEMKVWTREEKRRDKERVKKDKSY